MESLKFSNRYGELTQETEKHLLNLPFEIRHLIFTYTLTEPNPSPNASSNSWAPRPWRIPITASNRLSSSCAQYPHNLSLLLVNRQIHEEACLLPFTVNTLSFTPYFGSTVPSALRVLRKMKPWQRQAVRSVQLNVTSRDLVGRGVNKGIVDVFDLISEVGDRNEEVTAGGLRELEMKLSNLGVMACAQSQVSLRYEDYLDVKGYSQAWIVDGVAKITTLRKLRVKVDASEVRDEEAWKTLGVQLGTKMSWLGETGVEVEVRGRKEAAGGALQGNQLIDVIDTADGGIIRPGGDVMARL